MESLITVSEIEIVGLHKCWERAREEWEWEWNWEGDGKFETKRERDEVTGQGDD